MSSPVWDDIGRGAAFGALAGVALHGLGLRVSPLGQLQPADDGGDPHDPFDPRPPRARGLASQMLAGAALGALFGLVRGRVRRGATPLEGELYGLAFQAMGRGAWLAPLGLDAAPPESEALTSPPLDAVADDFYDDAWDLDAR